MHVNRSKRTHGPEKGVARWGIGAADDSNGAVIAHVAPWSVLGILLNDRAQCEAKWTGSTGKITVTAVVSTPTAISLVTESPCKW